MIISMISSGALEFGMLGAGLDTMLQIDLGVRNEYHSYHWSFFRHRAETALALTRQGFNILRVA